MKKILLILCIAALLSSCSVLENFKFMEPTLISPTPMPTAIPDPCAAENLMEEVEKIQDLVNTFQDVSYVANFTPQTELVIPILEMQNVRREMQKLDVPSCEEAIKTASLNYMNSTINYLALFMSGETKENVDAGIQNSQILWQVVLGEFGKLLTSAGLVSDELPDIGSTPPLESETTIFIRNEGTQRLNVRVQPDLNSDIIALMEPGMQAIGLSRTEAGDWLLINLDGMNGWVFAEMITSSVPVDELPIYDPEQ